LRLQGVPTFKSSSSTSAAGGGSASVIAAAAGFSVAGNGGVDADQRQGQDFMKADAQV
jgi:hypothetical protein